MEHNKKFLWKNWLSGLWIGLFLASSTITFAEGGNTDPVEFEGSWHEGICSLSLECPVSVTVDALYLYI